jgi:hypothetical protein
MRLNPQQVQILRDLYRLNDYPSDRLARDRSALVAFTTALCGRLGAQLTPEEVADELLRVRKDKKGTGGLPYLGRNPSGPHLN